MTTVMGLVSQQKKWIRKFPIKIKKFVLAQLLVSIWKKKNR